MCSMHMLTAPNEPCAALLCRVRSSFGLTSHRPAPVPIAPTYHSRALGRLIAPGLQAAPWMTACLTNRAMCYIQMKNYKNAVRDCKVMSQLCIAIARCCPRCAL